ncbi:MAG: T9SS type A sorting domain-containing protein [Bacteroidales bacterium]|nr:T9SS type A sorting domain-containing protein [Bacteroidales bacterium]
MEKPALVAIHPNPTDGDVKINIQKPGIKIEEVKVYDITGKQYEVNWSQKNLDMHKLPDGMYFIRVDLSSGNTISKKILKNKRLKKRPPQKSGSLFSVAGKATTSPLQHSTILSSPFRWGSYY